MFELEGQFEGQEMPSFTGIVMNDNMNFSVTNGSVRLLIDLFSIEILFYRTKFWLEVLISIWRFEQICLGKIFLLYNLT